MSCKRVWKKLLGVEQVVIEDWDIDENDGAVVVAVRAKRQSAQRCPRCMKRCPMYDLFTRMAHGFRRVEALIGLAMLKLARLCPPLPGRC